MKKLKLLTPLIILISLFFTYNLSGISPLGEHDYIYFKVINVTKKGIKGVRVGIESLGDLGSTDGYGEVKIEKDSLKDGQKVEIILEVDDKELVCYDEDTGKEVKNIIFTIDFSSKEVIHIPLINKESLEYRSKELSLKDKINKLEEEVETLEKEAVETTKKIKELEEQGAYSADGAIKIEQASRKKIEAKEKQIEKSKVLNAELQEQLKILKEHKSKLEKEIQEYKAKLLEVENKLTEQTSISKDQVLSLKVEIERLNRELSWRDEALGKKEKELRLANDKITGLRESITALKTEIGDLTLKKHNERREYKEKIKKLKEIRKNDSLKLSEQKYKLEELESKVAQQERISEQQKEEIRAFKEEIKIIEASLNDTNTNLEDIQKVLDAAIDNIEKAADDFFKIGHYQLAANYYRYLYDYDVRERYVMDKRTLCDDLQKQKEKGHEYFEEGWYKKAKEEFKAIVEGNELDEHAQRMAEASALNERDIAKADSLFFKGDIGAQQFYRDVLKALKHYNITHEKARKNFLICRKVRKMMGDASHRMISGQYDLAIKLYEEVEQSDMPSMNLRDRITVAKNKLTIKEQANKLKEDGNYQKSIDKWNELARCPAFDKEISQLEVLNKFQIEARAFEKIGDIKNTISAYVALNKEHDTHHTRSKVTEQLEGVIEELNNFEGQSDEKIQASAAFYNKVIKGDTEWIQTTFYKFCKKYNAQDGGREITQRRYGKWLYNIGLILYNNSHIVQDLKYGQQQKMAKGYLYMASELGLVDAEKYWANINKKNFDPKVCNRCLQQIKLIHDEVSNVDIR